MEKEPRLLLAGRNRGWPGAVRAPVRGYRRRTIFYAPDSPTWAGGNCYLTAAPVASKGIATSGTPYKMKT